MPFGLCNALMIFQLCMMSILSDIVEDTIKVLLDDFFKMDDSFDDCLAHFELCVEKM